MAKEHPRRSKGSAARLIENYEQNSSNSICLSPTLAVL